MPLRIRNTALAAALAGLVAGAVAVPAAAAPAPTPTTCDATRTPPEYAGKVPDPKDVLGFDLGDQEVTAAQSDTLLRTISRTSDRVVDGVAATTAQGRPVRYAIAGKPENVTPAGLARVRAATARIRDPRTPDAEVRRLAKSTPQILWIAGNVHGNEESGTDASLRVLRDLADRTDCAAKRITDHAIVVIMPTQNPDGREADTRTNAYDFDMNRDWFARTQPEVDGKVALTQQYPPLLFIDAHEMPSRSGYFFPPNSDPIYHETPERSVKWINDTYGAAMTKEFTSRGIPFFNGQNYDLFYQGYGDTVPTSAYLGAGMTFEKGGVEPIRDRTDQQYLTQWTSLSAAAADHDGMLRGWHANYVDALKQGEAGKLEPNVTYNPDKDVQNPVPDRTVRHYFLRADDPAKAREVATVVRRLQRMGVEVRRLTRPLTVPDYRAYGRSPARTTLPAGTYWVPMAQPQKHWVQAMLNEDTYVPFPYFYDVSAWSLPLLANVPGGSSGRVLRPAAHTAAPVAAPAPPQVGKRPRIGVLDLTATLSGARQSTGWLRSRLDRDWKLPFRLVGPSAVRDGALADVDVLLVPDVPAASAETALGADGADAVRSYVTGGGRYVGWAGGTELAARLKVTGATLTEAKSAVPGSLFRADVAARGPLARGAGRTVWNFYASEPLMTAAHPGDVAVSYPAASSPDWFVSGYQEGAEELGGTAAVVDEQVGAGRSVQFATDPNFRAFSDGTAKLLFNAITGGGSGGAPAAAPDRTDAARAARTLGAAGQDIRVAVRPGDAPGTETALRKAGLTWTKLASSGRVTYVVANRWGDAAGDQAALRRLPGTLRAQGVRPLLLTVP